MSPEELISRVEAGELVIINTILQTMFDRQKSDNFDAFYDWLEKTNTPAGEILNNGEVWRNRDQYPPAELTKGNWVIQNAEATEKEIYIFKRSEA